MPGTFPQLPVAQEILHSAEWLNRVTQSQNGKFDVQDNNAMRWILTCIYPTMNQSEAAAIRAFMNANRGNWATFEYVVPGRQQLGELGGDPKVKDTTLAGNDKVILKGLSKNRVYFKTGDFIRFSHRKVYEVSEDVITDNARQAEVPISPGLVQTVFSGERVITTGISFKVRLAQNTLPQLRASPGELYTFDPFQLIEDI